MTRRRFTVLTIATSLLSLAAHPAVAGISNMT